MISFPYCHFSAGFEIKQAEQSQDQPYLGMQYFFSSPSVTVIQGYKL